MMQNKVINFTNDTGLIVPAGLPTLVKVAGSDTDVVFSDTVQLSWGIWKPQIGCLPRGNLSCYDKTDSAIGLSLTHTFALEEEYLTVRATDRSGAFLEQKIWMEYPVVDSTGKGPLGLSAASKVLTKELKFIIGGKVRDTTVLAEMQSIGTTGLEILSVTTQKNDQKWLKLKLNWTNGINGPKDSVITKGPTTNDLKTAGKTISIDPNDKLIFSFTFFSDSLRGDSILIDTLIVKTNDFANPVVKIPLRMKYDDLPLLRLGVPGAKAFGPTNGFNTAGLPSFVPARSNLTFTFSERVKIKDPKKVFKIYSYLDSLKNPDGFRLINGDFTYRFKINPLAKVSASERAFANPPALVSASDSLADSVIFTPRYDSPSDSVKVQPAPGFFIYRDILHIKISNGITDTTGNSLDLRLDRGLQAAGTFDTIFQAKVDTGFFTVSQTDPKNGSIEYNPDLPIRIRFNRKLAQRPPLGIDTLTLLDVKNLEADSNHCIKITSTFLGKKSYNLQFISLEDGDSTLVFKTRPRLPALDTVTIRLIGGLMDTSGLSLDGNGNKMPDWLYHQIDSLDVYTFSFLVRDQGFYVYPNPYKFSDPRHTEKGSMTFKNLNTLKGFVKGQALDLRIYSMNGDLVFASHDEAAIKRDTKKDRITTTMDWDIKNRSGDFVGTGVYIFTVMTTNSKLLHKGKVAVIR